MRKTTHVPGQCTSPASPSRQRDHDLWVTSKETERKCYVSPLCVIWAPSPLPFLLPSLPLSCRTLSRHGPGRSGRRLLLDETLGLLLLLVLPCGHGLVLLVVLLLLCMVEWYKMNA